MTTTAARRKARRFLLQALYQIELTSDSVSQVEKQFLDDHDMKRVDTDYLHDVLTGIGKDRDRLWEVIDPCLDRPRKELDPVERCILIIGAYELLERIDVPYKVVIDEGIELAQVFGASGSFKYINTVLDKIAKAHRQAEAT